MMNDLWGIDTVYKYDKNGNYIGYVKPITEFVSEDLSNWYIRRNRKRFWDSELTDSKKAVYQTTYEVLVGLSQLIAPITPFISEEIYRNLTGEESVHLSNYPECNQDLLNETLEEKIEEAENAKPDFSQCKVRSKIIYPMTEISLDRAKYTVRETSPMCSIYYRDEELQMGTY